LQSAHRLRAVSVSVWQFGQTQVLIAVVVGCALVGRSMVLVLMSLVPSMVVRRPR
jgi:hypothetical protein